MRKQVIKTIRHINCLHCDKPIETTSKIQKYCSKHCGDRYWAITHPKRRKEIWQKYNETHLPEINERTKKWHKENKKPPMTTAEKRINTSRGIARQRLVKYRAKICADCGTPKVPDRRIECHHIDKNVFNNSLNNLQWLCSVCHGMYHRDD